MLGYFFEKNLLIFFEENDVLKLKSNKINSLFLDRRHSLEKNSLEVSVNNQRNFFIEDDSLRVEIKPSDYQKFLDNNSLKLNKNGYTIRFKDSNNLNPEMDSKYQQIRTLLK